MIWFILDDKGTPDVFNHGEYSYPVLNVVNEETFLLNNEGDEIEEENNGKESIIDDRTNLISDVWFRYFSKKWRALTASGQNLLSLTI